MKINQYTRHEHRQTPRIFYLKLWTFDLLFFYLDMEFLGLFGVCCGLLSGFGDLGWGTSDVLFL